MSDMRSRPGQKSAYGKSRSGKHRRHMVSLGMAGRLLHFFGALAMVLGLFLPLTESGRALAAPDPVDMLSRGPSQEITTGNFTQIAAVGDFQSELGCNAFDINCGVTQLTNHNGLWTSVFSIPPGQWQWQIAAMTQDGQQIALSDQGIDQTGQIQVADNDAGVWFRFNAPQQEASAAPVEQIATLSTDIGAFALEPVNGDFTAIIPSQGNPINAEMQLDGAPVGNPQVIQASYGPTEVTLDQSGNLINVEELGYATLTITRMDGATGQPLPNGCSEVRDGGKVINRGCDTDDGVADGSLMLTFPEGIEPGTYTVAEVTAPDGAEQAPDQDVDLQLTDNSIEITTGEAAPEEPTATEVEGEPTATETGEETDGIEQIPSEDEEATETPAEATEPSEEEAVVPGDLIVTLQDQSGAPLGGACFQLLDDGGDVVAESCDVNDAFPNNGNTGFFGVDSGTYTLHQSTAPEGAEPIQDQSVDVSAGDEQTVVVQAPASAEPTPVPTGDIVVQRQDSDGNAVGGACFQLIDQNGQTVGDPVCDEDGDVPDDGRIGFFDVPEGTYTLRETRTPEGAEQAADTQVVVTGDLVTEQPVQSALTPTEVPTEEPTEVPTKVPTATTVSTEEAEPTVGASATEAPTEVPIPGDLIITLQDQQGNPIGGACFELQQDDVVLGPICDADDPFPGNGNTGFFGVPSGTYTVHESTVPDGTQPIEDQEVEVPAGDGQTVIVQAPETPVEPTATAEPTAEVTVTAESTATEAPDEPPTAGEVVVDVPAAAAQGQVCVELNTSGGIAMLNAPSACNTDGGDSQEISLEGISEGSYSMYVTEGPEDLVDAEPKTVIVEAGVTTEVALQAQPATGILPVLAVDAEQNPLAGACWTLTRDSYDSGALCDDGVNGGTEGDGQVQFEGVPVGDGYTLTETTTPEGYVIPDAQTVTVNEGQNETVTVLHQRQTGTVTITTTDSTQTPLGGACFSIDSGEPVCDDDGDGTVTIENVPTGQHTLSQSTAPDGYNAAPDQMIDVTTDGVTLSVENVRQTGSIVVQAVDPDGSLVSGFCVIVDDGDQQCDGGPVDTDGAEDGSISLDGVPTGDHQVTLTSVPDGFELPTEGMAATVDADTAETVSFELTWVAPTTGGLDVMIQMDSEEPVPGVCVTLTSTADEAELGPFCDGGESDTNADPGVIGIEDVPLDSWVVALTSDTEIDGGDVAQANTPSIDVTVDQRAQALITVPALPTTGTVQIVTTDGSVNLTGACYDLVMGDTTTSVCDNDDLDNDGTEGVIEVLNVRPGTWTVTMTQAPDGYESANSEVNVAAGETATVEVVVTAIPQPGLLRITKVDDDGDVLGGSCFALTKNGQTIQSICDASDATPNDGVMEMTDLDAGTYQLVETRAPASQYKKAEPQAVTITAGTETEITVTNVTRPGRLVVVTVTDSDRSQQLDNACYRLEGDTTFGPFCDADDGNVDGRVNFVNVTAGDYSLVQTVAPAGYDLADSRDVTITAGASLQVTVVNAETPPPAEAGTLAVIPLDEKGEPVPGGCYQVLDGETPVTGRVCDNADDTDARITFENLPVGSYMVRELLAPSPEFVMAADQDVTINVDETTEVQISHTVKPGRVVVQAVNTLGQPVQGACFDLKNDGQEPACSGASGDVLFKDVPAGKTSLIQTKAPTGYKLDDTPRDVTVSPGQTTVLRIVFETAPPPDSGSVQVQKFICPAGDDGERTQFLGGAQGNAQLAKTAGCVQGEAAFTLVAEDGSGNGPGAFSTGTDGRYQVTVKKGIYVLTETDPDLPGSSAARLRVGVGQMTTVIVINYVAPPKPEPTNIDVTSYTCPPSFNGTSYTDFVESCTSEQAKSNNLTVRAEGAQKFKQVTGDGGVLGKTTFEDLPAGKYVVYGEKPYNVPIMYLFCGANANDLSDAKAINGSVSVSLEGGQTITCDFFLVPEQLTKDTGGVLVQKFSCPIDKPAKGYDWANECERSATQVPFSLGVVEKETKEVQPLAEITANPDGIVRFTNLSPGTYKLEEVGAKWCFAQSNSVDADGNVVVNPNRLSEVWIYNCVGTSQPPNTGSGDAARLLNPDNGTPSGTLVLLNFSWPAIALMAWMVWRSRHGDHSPVIVRRDDNRAA